MKGTQFRILMLTFLLAPLLMQAQKESNIKLGLRVAPALSWLKPGTTGYESDGMRFGFSAGLVSEFYFADNYAISTGFSFLFPSGKLTYRDRLLRNNDTVEGVLHNIYKFSYFEIPLMIKMRTNQFGQFSFFGQIGIGTAFKMKATAEAEFTPDVGTPEKSEPEINNKTTLMRESVLAGIGLEYHIDKTTRIFAGVNYSGGLNNILKGKNGIPNAEGTLNDVKGVFNFVELNIGVLF